jgi:hypothetical protein
VGAFGFSFVLFLRRRLATDDLKQHFAKEKVEDSWFVLSLDRQTDAEIALFLADDETVPKTLEEQEKPLVTLVDMGSSYTASVLDTSLEVFDNYGETSAEISSAPSVAVPSTRSSEGGAEQVRQIAVRVCKDDDGSMHFGQATITSSEGEASSGEKEELFRLREEVSRLSQQLNRVTDLQAQIDMLKTVFSGTRVDDSLLGAAAVSHRVVTFDVAPPPPPPPPPPAPGTVPENGSAKKRAQVRSEAFATVPTELSSEQVEQVVRSEIGLSGKTPVAIRAAIDNFLRAFARPEHKVLLQKLATDYAFLIRALPLQPLDCVKKMSAWERLLFKGMDEAGAAALRKRKQIEIATLPCEAVEEEVAKIRKAETVRIQKEQEARVASQIKGDLLGALKERFDAQKEDEERAAGELELSMLQMGTLEDLGIAL